MKKTFCKRRIHRKPYEFGSCLGMLQEVEGPSIRNPVCLEPQKKPLEKGPTGSKNSSLNLRVFHVRVMRHVK